MVRLPFSKGALIVGLFVLSVSIVGCYTMMRHPTVSQPPPIHPDSAATYSHDSGYTMSCTDCHNNMYDHSRQVYYWNDWGWYPNYYTGYMGWRRYYWRPWWYDHYYRYPYGYYYGGSSGGGGTSDPPSKREFGRRELSDPATGGPPVYTPPPVQQPQQPQSPPPSQQPQSGKRPFPKSQDDRNKEDDQNNGKRRP